MSTCCKSIETSVSISEGGKIVGEATLNASQSTAAFDTLKSELGIRNSVQTLQRKFEKGDQQPIRDLFLAWNGIKNDGSFFRIAGYHGEPFEKNIPQESLYWGGYCQHQNILFPTWHRGIMLALERAMQKYVPGIRQPYWDECDAQAGIPWLLSQKIVTFNNGDAVENPLLSFTLPMALVDTSVISDRVGDETIDINSVYSKPAGYKTVRYPYSGLVGTDAARQSSEEYNASISDEEGLAKLNTNVASWFYGQTGYRTDNLTVIEEYQKCLLNTSYNEFSNTTSNTKVNAHGAAVVSLETPHNDVHLCIGGFPTTPPDTGVVIDESPASGSPSPGHPVQILGNGDMGENNTAAFDPIFFFHHCFIDYVFWIWQKKHNQMEKLILEAPADAAHNGADASNPNTQGPSRGQDPNETLSLATPLKPFCKDDPFFTEFGSIFLTSDDLTNIHNLGYDFEPSTLELSPQQSSSSETDESSITASAPVKLSVRCANRAAIEGSFVVHVFASINGNKFAVGKFGVLSRFNVMACRNCTRTLDVGETFTILNPEILRALNHAPSSVVWCAQVHTRKGLVEISSNSPDLHLFSFSCIG